VVVLGLASACIGVPSAALADVSRAQCVEAYERAQYTRRESKLREARQALLVCAQDACPAATRTDCVPWLAEVERTLPTITLAARDERGRDLVDATFTVDGEAQAASAAGAPITVDPGPHKVRVVLPNGRSLEEQLVAHVGEKNRLVPLVIKDPAIAAGATPGAVPPASGAAPAPERRSLVVPIALTAAGVAGLTVAVLIGQKAKSDSEDLRSSCSPRCSSSDISAVESKLLYSDIALGVGVASLAVATYFWLRPSSSPAAQATTPRFTAGARPGSLALHF
jgi:hypothetical protein